MNFRAALAGIKPAAIKPYTFADVLVNGDAPVTVFCRHAGYSNPALAAAQLKAFNERRGRATDGKVTAEKMDADRILDAKLFAQHVVQSWENVFEDAPAVATDQPSPPVATPCTPAKVEEFLMVLSEYRLDKFREFTAWASNADNFVDTPIGDPVALGK